MSFKASIIFSSSPGVLQSFNNVQSSPSVFCIQLSSKIQNVSDSDHPFLPFDFAFRQMSPGNKGTYTYCADVRIWQNFHVFKLIYFVAWSVAVEGCEDYRPGPHRFCTNWHRIYIFHSNVESQLFMVPTISAITEQSCVQPGPTRFWLSVTTSDPYRCLRTFDQRGFISFPSNRWHLSSLTGLWAV